MVKLKNLLFERVEIKKCPLTKKSISDFMKWSGSRYNTFSKKDAVNYAYDMLKYGFRWVKVAMGSDNYKIAKKKKWKIRPASPMRLFNGEELNAVEIFEPLPIRFVFTTGSYTSTSSMGAWDYLVDSKKKYIARGIGDLLKFEERERLQF